MNSPAIIAAVGIVLNTMGVIGLFFFAMPYRTRQHGDRFLSLGEHDPELIRTERLYDWIAGVSLAFIVIGSTAQIVALLL